MKKKMHAGLVLLAVLMILTGCIREEQGDDGGKKTDAGYTQGTESGENDGDVEEPGDGEDDGDKEELDGVMDAVQSRLESSPEGTVEYLSIVTNTDKVEDLTACAEEVIEHCIANDFRNMLFSYDMSGYPIELHATVYLTREDMTDNRPVFEMDYEQDKEGDVRYNIKDHPEKFHLTIKCSTCGNCI